MTRSEFKRLQDILGCADDLAELVAMGKIEFYGNKFWTIATTSVPDLAQKIRAKFPDLDSEVWSRIGF